MTASWVRARAGKFKNKDNGGESSNAMDIDTDIELCDFYEVYHAGKFHLLPNLFTLIFVAIGGCEFSKSHAQRCIHTWRS